MSKKTIGGGKSVSLPDLSIVGKNIDGAGSKSFARRDSQSLPATIKRVVPTPGKLVRLNDALPRKMEAAAKARLSEISQTDGRNKLMIVGAPAAVAAAKSVAKKSPDKTTSPEEVDIAEDVVNDGNEYNDIQYNDIPIDLASIDSDYDGDLISIALENMIDDSSDIRPSIEKLLYLVVSQEYSEEVLVKEYLEIFSSRFSIFKPSPANVNFKLVDINSEHLYPDETKPELQEFWNVFSEPEYILSELRKAFLSMMQDASLEDMLYYLKHNSVDARMFYNFLEGGVYDKIGHYGKPQMRDVQYTKLIEAWAGNKDNHRTMVYLADAFDLSESEAEKLKSKDSRAKEFAESILKKKFKIKYATIAEDENEEAYEEYSRERQAHEDKSSLETRSAHVKTKRDGAKALNISYEENKIPKGR
jgi:hypothetical protein